MTRWPLNFESIGLARTAKPRVEIWRPIWPWITSILSHIGHSMLLTTFTTYEPSSRESLMTASSRRSRSLCQSFPLCSMLGTSHDLPCILTHLSMFPPSSSVFISCLGSRSTCSFACMPRRTGWADNRASMPKLIWQVSSKTLKLIL